MNKRWVSAICILAGVSITFIAVTGWYFVKRSENEIAHQDSANPQHILEAPPKEISIHASSTFQYVNESDIQSLPTIAGSDYRKDAQRVFYGGIILSGADPATFVYIGNGYGKDLNKVYAGGLVLENADPDTFTIINDTYAKDKRYVYAYGSFKPLENSDPATFAIIDDVFAKDAHHVYGRPMNGNIMTLPYADPATFSLEPFRHDSTHVYTEALCDGETSTWGRHCFKIIEGADPATFTSVEGGIYDKDKSHIYYGGQMIEDADVLTFHIHEGGKYGFTYAYDKDHIFVYGVRGIESISGADIDTFDSVGGYYYRDKQYVWYGGVKLKDADPASFYALDLGEYYGKDADSVYFGATLITDADAPSFRTLGGLYTQDKYRTYKEGVPIP